jgi:hypothetical protein
MILTEWIILHGEDYPLGNLLMVYPDGPCEVEFADGSGRTYAILPIQPEKLIVLHDSPDYAAA